MLQSAFLALDAFTALYILIIFIAILVAIGLYFVIWALRRKPVTGVESLKGQIGVVTNDLTENGGEVSLDGVIWKAKLSDSSSVISKGERVVVVDVSSLTLLVRRKEK